MGKLAILQNLARLFLGIAIASIVCGAIVAFFVLLFKNPILWGWIWIGIVVGGYLGVLFIAIVMSIYTGK